MPSEELDLVQSALVLSDFEVAQRVVLECLELDEMDVDGMPRVNGIDQVPVLNRPDSGVLTGSCHES